MKKSQLRKIIKEEISKELKESNLSVRDDQRVEDFVRELEKHIHGARQLQFNDKYDMDFDTLLDQLQGELEGLKNKYN